MFHSLPFPPSPPQHPWLKMVAHGSMVAGTISYVGLHLIHRADTVRNSAVNSFWQMIHTCGPAAEFSKYTAVMNNCI